MADWLTHSQTYPHTHVYTHTRVHTHTRTRAHRHTNTHNQRYLKWSICKSTQTGQCLDSSLDLLIAKAPWFTAWVKKYKWRKDAYITHMYNQWRDLRLKYKIHTVKSVFISQVFISSDGQLAEHYTRSVTSPGQPSDRRGAWWAVWGAGWSILTSGVEASFKQNSKHSCFFSS